MTGQAIDGPDIYVVEDDIRVRQALLLIFSRAGYRVSCFADGQSLIDAVRAKPAACILLDIQLPGPSGIEILERLNEKGNLAPVVIVSGVQDIKTAVEALKSGAVDFVEKPFSGTDLLIRVEDAIRASAEPNDIPSIPTNFPGSGSLTQREREVLELSALGKSSKQIASALGLSPRTIEDHRASLLRKTRARNLAELVRKIMTVGKKGSG